MNGINTGKIIIGCAYTGEKRGISPEDAVMQRIILAQMPANAVNRAAIVSLSPEAYHHIPRAEKMPPSAFKRFRDFLSRVAKVTI
jgi:hypothetical protein